MRPHLQVQRWRVRVRGVVQGVGFRPFVYKLADAHELSGWVLNDPQGVLVEVQGPEARLGHFTTDLTATAPPQARVDSLEVQRELGLEPGTSFTIKASVQVGPKLTLVPTDGYVCADCLSELRDPADRRYRYPFINCTNCGPRYSIVQSLPYDRAHTTMARFVMCEDCLREYADPMDRRYHAQPNACPACGPELLLADRYGRTAAGEAALDATVEALSRGQIVAVKSLGGFHLAVDARDAEAVGRLRKLKRRDAKPFALMARDLDAVAAFARFDHAEADLMSSPARPIVLVRKRTGTLPDIIAPHNPNLGVMLPSAPQHHLLLAPPELGVLVMTSGNVSGRPIVYRNEDALAELFEIAEVILYNDRDIEIRVDDSVVRVSAHPELHEPVVSFSAGTGYAPYPVEVGTELGSIVAHGAELKTTVALSSGTRVYLSQHIGDLKNDETFQSHRRAADHLAQLHDLRPQVTVSDLHPQFRATRAALSESGVAGRAVQVQHHHAHMASCMAENHLGGTVLGVVFDGAGYGEDGTIWGGEFLVGSYRSVRRIGHLRHLPLLGGDQAVRHPIRTGFALALDALGNVDAVCAAFPTLNQLDAEQRHVFDAMARRGINAPLTSSMGRLFDGVAALLGVCAHAEYEAQGPIQLEGLLARALSMSPAEDRYRFDEMERDGLVEIDFRPVVRAIAADLAGGTGAATISRRFHSGVVDMVVARCLGHRTATPADSPEHTDDIVLSGGVFLNEFLLVNCLVELRRAGFGVHCHRQVPTNDGGIALGQVLIADAILAAEGIPEDDMPALKHAGTSRFETESRPHVIVIHRWRDRYALYADYLDHRAYRVCYVTTELGRQSVPTGAAEVVVVAATDDLVALRSTVARLIDRFGPPERIVALNEGDLDGAAILRSELGCGGDGPPEVSRFRDKLPMVSIVAAAGVRVPAFADAPNADAVRAFADVHGWPVVVKPRRGTASRGVVFLASTEELAHADLSGEPHLVQTFVADPIFHIDGLWTGTALGPWRASRYMNSCVEFNEGKYLGSVEVDDRQLLAHIEPFVTAVADALCDRPWIFHLEAFVGSDSDGSPRLTFLEAGARVGGAEIPFLWREVHGVDLMSLAVDIQLGKEPPAEPLGPSQTAGWLLLPVPAARPCRVVDTAFDLQAGDGPYAQALPAKGAIIQKIGGYEHVGARFRFRGTSSEDVEAAIRKTVSSFHMRCEPLPA